MSVSSAPFHFDCGFLPQSCSVIECARAHTQVCIRRSSRARLAPRLLVLSRAQEWSRGVSCLRAGFGRRPIHRDDRCRSKIVEDLYLPSTCIIFNVSIGSSLLREQTKPRAVVKKLTCRRRGSASLFPHTLVPMPKGPPKYSGYGKERKKTYGFQQVHPLPRVHHFEPLVCGCTLAATHRRRRL